MSAPSDADVPLFEPADVGLDVDSWEELDPDDDAVRCRNCHHPVTSDESRATRLGPTCAAKFGRAVALGTIQVTPAQPQTDQPQPS